MLVAQGAEVRLLDEILRAVWIVRQAERTSVERVQVRERLVRKGGFGGGVRHEQCQCRSTCLSNRCNGAGTVPYSRRGLGVT